MCAEDRNSSSFWVNAMLQFVLSTGANPEIFFTPWCV